MSRRNLVTEHAHDLPDLETCVTTADNYESVRSEGQIVGQPVSSGFESDDTSADAR